MCLLLCSSHNRWPGSLRTDMSISIVLNGISDRCRMLSERRLRCVLPIRPNRDGGSRGISNLNSGRWAHRLKQTSVAAEFADIFVMSSNSLSLIRSRDEIWRFCVTMESRVTSCDGTCEVATASKVLHHGGQGNHDTHEYSIAQMHDERLRHRSCF